MILSLLVVFLVQHVAQSSDSDCGRLGGTCKFPLLGCRGGSFRTGLCSSWYKTCCVPDLSISSSCTARTGRIKFYIQRASTLGTTYYTVNSVSTIPASYLQGGRIHILTHGWKQNARDLQDLGWELYRHRKGPVVVVDWAVWSGSSDPTTYIPACKRTSDVGAEVAQFILELEKRGHSRSNMHLIGFSLGGKVSARAGDCLQGKVARLTGLDTPLYCIDKELTQPELDESDAQFVDTIRTTGLSGVWFQQQGHADFFVGCNNLCTCFDRGAPWTLSGRHGEAVNIFKNSIANSNCQIGVSKACICPLPICSRTGNTMGYPATKPSRDRKYMVDMDGKGACEN